MSAPITIDIEVTSPAAVALEVGTPAVDVTPDPDGAQVVVVAVPGPPGPPGDGTPVFGEAPAGIKDGSNPTFTLASTPRAGTTAVYRNGLREHLGTGYTVSASAITFSSPPISTDDITVDYLLEG